MAAPAAAVRASAASAALAPITPSASSAAAATAQQAPLPPLPSWYDPARFEQPDATSDRNTSTTTTTSKATREAVAALRRAAPSGSLAEVAAALEAHLARLQAGIAEAVNTDYGEFVALPGRLAGLDAAAGRMRAPLERAAEAARAAQRDVKGELAALRGSLARRQAAAEARATLELMQEAAAAAHKLEALLGEADAMMAAAAGLREEQDEREERERRRQQQQQQGGEAAASEGAAATTTTTPDQQQQQLAARGRLLERAAAEAGRLAFLSARGEGLIFLRALAPRAAAARSALDSHLRAALSDALTARDWQCATHCLRACVELGDGGAAEAALRASLAAPVIRARLEKAAAEARQGGVVVGGGGLGSAGDAAAAAAAAAQQPLLSEALSGLLQAVLDAGSAGGTGGGGGVGAGSGASGALVLLDPSAGFTSSIDLLGAVVLAELNDQLGTLLPASFGFASLPAFRANHRAARALLRQLERAAPTAAALGRLRGCPAWAAFARRWNLPVYFSLQYQSIAGALEEACSSAELVRVGGGVGAGGGSGSGRAAAALAPTAALADGLERCFSPAVYVPQLGDRFFRLACQLAARYCTWVADVGSMAQQQQQQQQGAAGGEGGGGGGGGGGGDDDAASSAPPPPPPPQERPLLGPDGTPLEASSAPLPPQQPKPPLAWAAAASPAELALVCADADAAAALLRGPARMRALAALRPAAAAAAALSTTEADDDNDHDDDDDPEAAEAARRAEQAAAAALESAAVRVESAASRSVLRALAAGAVARCAAALQQVKGVTATYRMTSKGPPTRHSHYAATVLAPLAELLGGAGGGPGGGGGGGGGIAAALSPPSRVVLAAGAVAEVSARFRDVADEVLSAVRKTESSLQRLKKNRAAAAAVGGGLGGAGGGGGGGGDDTGLSDSEKIALQLLLDALEFGRRAAALGVALEASKVGRGSGREQEASRAAARAFAELVAAVRPPQGVPLPEGAASGLALFGIE
jgi:conserved oligomeric Golgi complex subunit 2